MIAALVVELFLKTLVLELLPDEGVVVRIQMVEPHEISVVVIVILVRIRGARTFIITLAVCLMSIVVFSSRLGLVLD